MMLNRRIRIVIGDNHIIFRNGLKILLSKFSSIDIIGEAKNGQEVIDLTIAREPDIVILDSELYSKSGVEATREILINNRNTKVISLTNNLDDKTIIDMLEAGVLGYVSKDIDCEELIDCIKSVYLGKPFFNKPVAERLSSIITKQQNNRYNFATFNEKERDVIKMLCMECSNKEIADKMNISKRTVEGHRLKIMDKIGAKSLAGIITYAVEAGIFKKPL
ncbi:MAG: response regulator transcription factor [Alphaproteobacteria bacterium]|nr:response regulator transcription factor [Alphaproteobacteria bacterium]